MLLFRVGSARPQHFQDLGHSFSLHGPPGWPITIYVFHFFLMSIELQVLMLHGTVFNSVAAAIVQAFQMVSVELLEMSEVSEMILNVCEKL